MIIEQLTIDGIVKHDVKERPRIIVSQHFEDKDTLRAIVKNQGFIARNTKEHWPRDLFVYNNQKLLTIEDFPVAAEQGNYVFGNKFCIATNNAFHEGDLFETKISPDYITGEEDREFLSEFLEMPVYIINLPTLDRFSNATDHIDRWILSLPASNKVIVEKDVYNRAKPIFKEMWEKESVQVITYSSGSESIIQPYNCLVLPNGFVISNKNTPKFNGFLREIGVEYECVDANKSYEDGGSIRCRTHYTPNFDLIKNLPDVRKAYRLQFLMEEEEEYNFY